MNSRRLIPYLHTSILFIVFALLWFLPEVAAWLDRKPDEAWLRVQSAGVLRFATDASYHPFEGVGDDGEFYGLDIDIAREVARRVGARAEFMNVGVDALYDAVRVGQADALISALPIDPARLGQWAYSRPYFDAGLVLMIRPDDEAMEVEDLPGHTIAVALGSDGDAWLRDYQRRAGGVTAARFESALDALQAVADGRADAMIVDGVTARQLLPTRFADLRVAVQVTNEPYAIAVWGESVDLLAALNRALDEMLADGMIERIVEEWIAK